MRTPRTKISSSESILLILNPVISFVLFAAICYPIFLAATLKLLEIKIANKLNT